MKQTDYLVKRLFDLLLSTIGIIICGWIILIAWLIASIDTKGNGFFLQTRVGQYGKLFTNLLFV